MSCLWRSWSGFDTWFTDSTIAEKDVYSDMLLLRKNLPQPLNDSGHSKTTAHTSCRDMVRRASTLVEDIDVTLSLLLITETRW
jgi:hypothetical protein